MVILCTKRQTQHQKSGVVVTLSKISLQNIKKYVDSAWTIDVHFRKNNCLNYSYWTFHPAHIWLSLIVLRAMHVLHVLSWGMLSRQFGLILRQNQSLDGSSMFLLSNHIHTNCRKMDIYFKQNFKIQMAMIMNEISWRNLSGDPHSMWETISNTFDVRKAKLQNTNGD